jgi:hypothetical protein
MNAYIEENEVEQELKCFYILVGKKIYAMRCLMRKTKLQNADYVLGNVSICGYAKSIIVLCNVMGFMIIYGIYLLM